MIHIYKLVEKNGEVTSQEIDTWNDGKFENSKEEMSRKEVLSAFNRGYNFTSEE